MTFKEIVYILIVNLFFSRFRINQVNRPLTGKPQVCILIELEVQLVKESLTKYIYI